MSKDTIKIGLFNRDAAIIVADGKGFLKQENIRVEINTVTDSPTLLRNLIKGNYDLILNNADNVIAWAEGQGEDPQNEVVQLLLAETKNNKSRAEAMYAQTISPTMGLTPRSRIDMEGIRSVIELREIAGLMKPPVPKPDKYVDERFYKKALATMGK